MFYDLVHKLNSTLDLNAVLAQVIEQVNQFLNIEATSVSLLDLESQELVIQVTVGSATDPKPGLRLPPYAGIAGWVAHHGEALLIPDAQQNERFYPAVDQLTGFTTRAMICVPLLGKDGPIGVIQVLSRSVGVFSEADLCYMNILADIAALAIENARLYTAEQSARRQAEALRLVAETVGSSLDLERVFAAALEQLHQVVSYDSAAVFVLKRRSPYRDALSAWPDYSDEKLDAHLQEKEYLDLVAAQGFDDPSSILDICVPVTDVALFRQICTYKRPISISDAQADGRYVHWAGTQPIRSWLGVPMIVQGEVIGQISVDRYRVNEFIPQEIRFASALAQQVAGAITSARLYREASDRADELSILNEVAMAVSTALDLDVILERALDTLLALLTLDAAGISLLDEAGERLTLHTDRGLAARFARAAQCACVQDDPTCDSVILSHRTLVLKPQPQEAGPQDKQDAPLGIGAFVPLLEHDVALGMLVVQSRDPSKLSHRQLSLMEAIGRQIGVAVGNARLYAQARRSRERGRSL